MKKILTRLTCAGVLPVLAGLLIVMQSGCLSPTSTLPTLSECRATCERELESIRTNRAPKMSADTSYTKDLDTLQADFRTQGDPDTYQAVMRERKRFNASRRVPDHTPTNLPPAIAQAQNEYRSVLEERTRERNRRVEEVKAPYLNALKSRIRMLFEQEKMPEIDGAIAEMKRVEAQARKIECAPLPSSPNQAAATELPPELRDGLMLYYSFDEDEDGKVTDQSGRNNHGIVHGAIWTADGKVGGAYRFNGVDGYAVSQGPIGLAGAAANTVCMWCKSVETAVEKVLWTMGDGNGAGDNVHGPLLHGTELFVLYGGSGATIPTHFDPEKWNFVCCAYDGTTQYLYVNGELIGKERRFMRLADHPFNIGRWKAGELYYYPFQGLIDEVMVFGRALSAAEIKQIYDLQK